MWTGYIKEIRDYLVGLLASGDTSVNVTIVGGASPPATVTQGPGSAASAWFQRPAGVPLVLNASALLLMVGGSTSGTTTSGAATLSWGTSGSNPGAGILAVSGLTTLVSIQVENLTGSSRAVKVFVGPASPTTSQTAVFDLNIGNNAMGTFAPASGQGIALGGLTVYILVDVAVGPYTGAAVSTINANTPLSITMLAN